MRSPTSHRNIRDRTINNDIHTYFGCAIRSILDEVKCLELAKAFEKLHNLLVIEIRWQASDEDFIGRVWNIG